MVENEMQEIIEKVKQAPTFARRLRYLRAEAHKWAGSSVRAEVSFVLAIDNYAPELAPQCAVLIGEIAMRELNNGDPESAKTIFRDGIQLADDAGGRGKGTYYLRRAEFALDRTETAAQFGDSMSEQPGLEILALDYLAEVSNWTTEGMRSCAIAFSAFEEYCSIAFDARETEAIKSLMIDIAEVEHQFIATRRDLPRRIAQVDRHFDRP